jgi:hypothetical protein
VNFSAASIEGVQIMKFPSAIALTLFALAGSLQASAHTVQYGAFLNGPSEAPPNASLGIGTALITLDLDLLTMQVDAVFSGLTGNVTASHIHCCTTTAGTSTAGVATTTPTFPGFPLGVAAGEYHQSFDLTAASTYNAAFVTANGGTIGTALDALILGLDSGKAYFNIHSSTSQGGEIRGFLAPVPLPAAVWLLASALGGLLPTVRRRAGIA